ncbi:MAG TPA: hypothetical protein VK369_13760, partial [Segetibacter sp.]|nr:hypothetical protein [Segetibacter sp.]
MKKLFTHIGLLAFMLFTTIFFSVSSLSAQSTDANSTVYTDKEDYHPGETVIIEGDGWESGEQVKLEIDHSTVTHGNTVLYATADDNGHIYNNEFVIRDEHLGETFILTATGQSSSLTAQTVFTDATITITSNTNWSAINTGSGPSGQPSSGDAIVVRNGATLTVDVANGACLNVSLGIGVIAFPGNGTLTFQAGKTVTCAGSVTMGGFSYSGNINMSAGGLLKIGGTFSRISGAFTAGAGSIEYNGTNPQVILGTTYNNLTVSNSGTKTLNSGTTTVGGDFNMTGGILTMVNVIADKTLSVNGSFTMSSGTLNMRISGISLGNATINVKGDFSHTGGDIREDALVAGSSNINFNGTSTQNYTSGGDVSNFINF